MDGKVCNTVGRGIESMKYHLCICFFVITLTMSQTLGPCFTFRPHATKIFFPIASARCFALSTKTFPEMLVYHIGQRLAGFLGCYRTCWRGKLWSARRAAGSSLSNRTCPRTGLLPSDLPRQLWHASVRIRSNTPSGLALWQLVQFVHQRTLARAVWHVTVNCKQRPWDPPLRTRRLRLFPGYLLLVGSCKPSWGHYLHYNTC